MVITWYISGSRKTHQEHLFNVLMFATFKLAIYLRLQNNSNNIT